MSLQKAGGIAALIGAVTYIVGFAVMGTVLNPGDTQGWGAAQRLGFVLEHQAVYQAWMLFIYAFFGAAFVVLAVALHERLRGDAAAWMPVASAFGLIWAGLVIASGMIASVGIGVVADLHTQDVAQAVTVWTAIGIVQEGLGGGVELVGGIWLLLVSCAALRSAALPMALNGLGIVVGVAGILTVAPPLGGLAAVFGLGQIPWFIWVGVIMLRR